MTKINIKTQIRLGFFALFTIMLLTTLYLIFQIRNISQNTKLIYEHPFKVSNTIRDIKTEIYKTARLIREIRYTENINELENLIIEINKSDSLIDSDLKIVDALYLGNMNDVDSLEKTYSDWKKNRNCIYLLKKENKIDSIDNILNQENRIQVNHIIYLANKISDFANNKAEQIFSKNIEAENKTIDISIVLLILASIFAFFFIFYLSKSIAKPIKTFVNDANAILLGQSENIPPQKHQEEEIFGLTLEELKKSYINIEQQNEEIKSINEQLANTNTSLEEKVKQRTIELQKSEEKYRLVSENSEDWIYLISPDGSIQFISPSFEKMTGYSISKIGQNSNFIEEITHPEDKEKTKCHYTKVNEECHSENIEFRIITKAGECIWIGHSCSPVYTPEGLYAGRRGTNRNITSRKLAEDKNLNQLKELERWYNVMLGRENRNQQLKREVNELLVRMGEVIRYPSQKDKLTKDKADENIDFTKV